MPAKTLTACSSSTTNFGTNSSSAATPTPTCCGLCGCAAEIYASRSTEIRSIARTASTGSWGSMTARSWPSTWRDSRSVGSASLLLLPLPSVHSVRCHRVAMSLIGVVAAMWCRPKSPPAPPPPLHQALHAWRDKVAREEHESTEYVLPNHMLFQLADVCPKKIQSGDRLLPEGTFLAAA